MKVINIKPHKTVVERVVCKQCGATLEYVPNDIKSYSGRDYSGGPDGCTWVDCGNCGKKVILTSW